MRTLRILRLFACTLFLMSCMHTQTRDMETAVVEKGSSGGTPVQSQEQGTTQKPGVAQEQSAESAKPEDAKVSIIEKIIIVEKPVYYPDTAIATQAPALPRSGGPDTVIAASQTGTLLPKDYKGGIIWYDFMEDFVYQVYCAPGMLTDIYLDKGEKLTGKPTIGDQENWQIGMDVSERDGMSVQHIYLKPARELLSTTVSINTNIRVYHILLKSFSTVYMTAVRWRYPDTKLPQVYLTSEGTSTTAPSGAGLGTSDMPRLSVNPATMSFDYRMEYPDGKNKPVWLPTAIYDDGKKTYIYLPLLALNMEIPGVFINDFEVVNYRISDNIIIIDRLCKVIRLKLQDIVVTITKKGA